MKDNLVYIEHMLDCIERIHEYAAMEITEFRDIV